MPTDAKCGLVVGVGLVLAVAVLFFPNDPPPAAAMQPPSSEPVRPRQFSPVPGRPASRTVEPDPLDSRLP